MNGRASGLAVALVYVSGFVLFVLWLLVHVGPEDTAFYCQVIGSFRLCIRVLYTLLLGFSSF